MKQVLQDPDVRASLHAALIESSDDAILFTDLSGVITSWNHGAEVMFGYTAAEMVGSSHTRLLPPESLDEDQQIQARVLRGEAVDHFERRKVGRDNREVNVLVTVSPVRDGIGKMIGVSRVMRDITQLRTREREADRERVFSAAMINSMPGVLYLYNAEGRFLRWNQQFEQATGRTADEIGQLHPLDLFRGADRDLVASRIGMVFETGTGHVEADLVRPDGSSTPYFFTGVRVEFEGNPCVVGVGIDVTARRNAEREQREIEERFRATFEQAAVGIAHVGIDGRIQRNNTKLCEITGYSGEELVGMPSLDLHAQEYRAAAAEGRQLLLDGARDVYSAEEQFIRKDGSRYWVSMIKTVLRGDDGSPKYYITVIADITARKELEEQFLRSQRMESLGALASGIAHDFNNLLTPMLMGADYLRQVGLQPGTEETVDSIETSAQRGADLVKQLLLFARGAHGAQMAVQVGHVIREMQRFVSSTFPRNITLKPVVPKNLWSIRGDPTQLNQVILNLCVNARDAMPDGGTLTLRASNVELDEQYTAMRPAVAPGKYVCLEAIDTGMGIPAGIREKIFEPFFSTKEPGKGTGLGLSTVREIVRSHGGHISVTSTLGEGTTFQLLFPGTAETKAPPVRGDVQAAPRGNGQTILVADSDPAVLDSICRSLNASGYTAMPAEDGAEALALFATNQGGIAATIVDLSVSVIGGAALVRTMRRIDPATPIIVSSGHAEGSVATPADASWMLHKPYSGRDMLGALNEVLKKA